MRGHTGFVRLVPVEHDPRTRLLADVARRIGLKSADAAAAAYDLSKQSLLVYVPKAAGDNGKFGLMAGLCFKPYDAPPAAWVDVLEQHHLIWVAAADCGDDAPAVRRIALLLDGVHAARQAWPVDPERVYLSMNTPTGPAVGAAFYYPEVFAGMIESPQAVWFATVKGFERPPQTWTTVTFARPQPSDLARARSHGRFFVVARDDGNVAADPAGKADPLAANAGLRRVVRHGYQATGLQTRAGAGRARVGDGSLFELRRRLVRPGRDVPRRAAAGEGPAAIQEHGGPDPGSERAAVAGRADPRADRRPGADARRVRLLTRLETGRG